MAAMMVSQRVPKTDQYWAESMVDKKEHKRVQWKVGMKAAGWE